MVHCKLDTTSPTEFQSDKSRVTVTVPEDVNADLYKISVLDSTDTLVYFENAKSKNIQVTVSSKIMTSIMVDAIKDNTSVYSGEATVNPGETAGITLKKLDVVGILAPENFSGEVTENNNVSLFWSVVAGATAYSVMRSTDGTTWMEISSTKDIGYIDADVKAGETYSYKIVVSGAGSVSVSSSVVEVTVPSEIINPVTPSTPSSVKAQAVSMSSIKVMWDDVSNAAEYIVVYKKTIGEASAEVVSNATEITLNGLDENTQYTITVAARNSAGTSVPSASTVCTTLSKTLEKPAVPTNVAATALSEKSINVTWDDVNSAVIYSVSYSTQANGTFTTRTSATNSLVLESLNASTTYYIKVTAGNTAGTSDQSAVVSAKTQEPAIQPPSAPVLTAVTVADTSLKVTWSAVSNASMYIIERSLISSGSFSAVCTTSALSYTDTKCSANTTYYYKGKAGNSAGYSSYSDAASAKTDAALSAPGTLTKGTVTDSSIAISWQAATGALSYKIYFSTSQSGTYNVHGTATGTQYTLNGLTSAATYYIKVTAISGSRESAASGVLSAQTAAKAPSVPTGVTAAAASAASITVTWTSVEGASSYIIYGGTSSSSLAQIGTSTSATYTHTGLTGATMYYYAVASVSAGGTSAKSTVSSATTGVSAPGVPSGVTAKAASSTSITVTWTAVTGASSYVIYGGTSSSSLEQIGTSSSASYTHTGLTAATTYYYAVASVNAGGTSRKSTSMSAATNTNAPSTPTGLTATAASSTSMTVKFNTVTGATGYKLYWSSNNSTFTQLSSLTSTTYTHTGLTANTTYYYKVSAVNGSVESAQSASVSAKTSAATKLAVINSNCNGCGRCPSSCTQGAIIRSGNKYIIDASKCDGCGKCVSRCPRGAISLK
jgi:fibronectin type 3 domain-containing protein/NAD-dependent dihydropyrimidine dehydrogenase PreA subunit